MVEYTVAIPGVICLSLRRFEGLTRVPRAAVFPEPVGRVMASSSELQVVVPKKPRGSGSHPLLLPEVISLVLQFTAWRDVYRVAALHRSWTKVVNARTLWSGPNGLLWREDTRDVVKDWMDDRRERGRSYLLQPLKARWEQLQKIRLAEEKARRDREWVDWV